MGGSHPAISAIVSRRLVSVNFWIDTTTPRCPASQPNSSSCHDMGGVSCLAGGVSDTLTTGRLPRRDTALHTIGQPVQPVGLCFEKIGLSSLATPASWHVLAFQSLAKVWAECLAKPAQRVQRVNLPREADMPCPAGGAPYQLKQHADVSC